MHNITPLPPSLILEPGIALPRVRVAKEGRKEGREEGANQPVCLRCSLYITGKRVAIPPSLWLCSYLSTWSLAASDCHPCSHLMMIRDTRYEMYVHWSSLIMIHGYKVNFRLLRIRFITWPIIWSILSWTTRGPYKRAPVYNIRFTRGLQLGGK